MKITEEQFEQRLREMSAWKANHPVRFQLRTWAIVAPFVIIPGLIMWHEVAHHHYFAVAIMVACGISAGWKAYRRPKSSRDYLNALQRSNRFGNRPSE